MTAQIGDQLTIDGETVHLMGCPALPWHHPRLVQIPEKVAMASVAYSMIFSTACWRQYIASWRIQGGLLFLDHIAGIYCIDGDEPLFADWVTEELRVSQGNLLT